MGERKIYCAGCPKYLGTIQKATLRKNIVFLCDTCEMERYLNASKAKAEPKETPVDNPFSSDVFGGVFGDIFKDKKL